MDELIAELECEEKVLKNAIWMMENEELNIEPMKVIDALIKARVRLVNVRKAKTLAKASA